MVSIKKRGIFRHVETIHKFAEKKIKMKKQ